MKLGTRFAALPRPLMLRLLPALRYLNLMRALELQGLAPWVRHIEGCTVLDVGCGHGLYTLDLAQRGARLIGCDRHRPSLTVAHTAASGLGLGERTLFLAADAANLPLPDGQFDLVVCNCVLEHIAEDRAALETMARCLRPGGILYLTVDNADHGLSLGLLERLPRQVQRLLLYPEIVAASSLREGLDGRLAGLYAVRRRYHADELTATLAELGLTVVDCRSYLGGVGAAHHESFHALRGLDPSSRVGRWLFMLSSPFLYPWAAWSDRRLRGHGYGLILVARREAESRA
jgi:ubiquinone/menaquinone biosynthesis C-methylase UbiE